MLRVVATSLRTALKPNLARTTSVAQVRNMSAAGAESDAEFDARYIAYFDRKDIDGWEIRKVRSPDQKIIILVCFYVTEHCREWQIWWPWTWYLSQPSWPQL